MLVVRECCKESREWVSCVVNQGQSSRLSDSGSVSKGIDVLKEASGVAVGRTVGIGLADSERRGHNLP